MLKKAKGLFKGAGTSLIACAAGIAAGYYIGDKGLRWFPNTVDIILIFLFTGICCLLGAAFSEITMQGTQKAKRLKRVYVLSMAAAIVCAIHFVGCQFQSKTALTAMQPEDFEKMVAMHVEQLDSFDREMESLISRMQGCSAFTQAKDQPLSAQDEAFLRQAWLSLYDYAFAVDQIRRDYSDWYRFDACRSQRPYHVQSFVVQFAADVMLYDKAMRIIGTIRQNPNAVKFLNAPHAGSEIGEESFSRFALELFGSDCGARINAGRLYLGWLDTGLQAHTATYCGGCMPLWTQIETRLAMMDKMGPLAHGQAIADADMELLRQGVNDIWFPAQKGVANWMGDTRLQRVGKYLIGPELQNELNGRLEPGDVLLSRKNWYMSNVGLPGFWPHAILYIGEPKRLMAYFDEPQVRDYLKQLCGKDVSLEEYMSGRFGVKWQRYTAGTGESDYHVIEAIKYGVLLHPLSKACGDYVVALRPKLDKVAKLQAIIEAFSHLDKPYDFDFDFATDHALVCTEVVWRCYRPDIDKHGLNFTLSDIAGRKTLPANEIARLYCNEKKEAQAQFEFVCFIDASEKTLSASFADEAAFIESVDRPKWSFMQQ